ARVERTDSPHPLRQVAVAIWGDDRVDVREYLLGYLLVVAGWVAIDVRTMPDSVADLAGATDALLPAELVEAARTARWEPLGTTHQLVAECRHPAVDYALRQHTQRAAEVLDAVRHRAFQVPHLGPLAADLPARLTDGGVRPATSPGGRAVYELPH